MPTRHVASLGTIALLSFFLFQSLVVSAEPVPGRYAESRDNNGAIGAPVLYRDTMLIVVTDEGVAAIVFQEKDAKFINKSAKYRFRFLKDAESEEISGTGIVLDGYDKEEQTVNAGPIRVGWSGGSHDRGWIYYQPENMQVCIAQAKRFDDTTEENELVGQQSTQKLDLKRFLKKQQ